MCIDIEVPFSFIRFRKGQYEEYIFIRYVLKNINKIVNMNIVNNQ